MSGVAPSPAPHASSNGQSGDNSIYERAKAASRPLSMPESPVKDMARSDEMFLPASTRPIQPTSAAPPQSVHGREKPVVRPKPQSMRLHTQKQIHASSAGSDNTDVLAARFSHLRVQQNAPSQGQLIDQQRRDSLDMSSSAELTPSSSDNSSHLTSGGSKSSVKPSGPRAIPVQPGSR